MKRYSVEYRAEVQGDTLVGYAAVFDQVAQLPGQYESLDAHVFDDVLASPETDVRALVDHDPRLLLGRQSSGTLRLSTDSHGLRFELDLPDTQTGRDVRELAGRGDLTGASFGFIPGDDKWTTARDGTPHQIHTRAARLLDVSAVTYPAYEGAGVQLRSIDLGRPNRARSQLVQARHRVRSRT